MFGIEEQRCRVVMSMAWLTLTLLVQGSLANVPYFFVDSNMALVLIPYDVPVGTTIYRLKAADSDRQYPLGFSVPDSMGSALVDLLPYPCPVHQDFCVCDVILRRPLEAGVTSTFRVRVKDTAGQVTTVVSKIKATRGHSSVVETFMEIMKPLRVEEDTAVNTVLKTVKARRGDRNIKFDIRGTDLLALENSRLTRTGAAVDLVLKKPLDFEADNLIEFNLFAEHGYRDTDVDTRNVVAMSMILLVEDVQDTPPRFIDPPSVVTVRSNTKPGDVVATFDAVDADKRKQREVRYRLDSHGSAGFDNYFSIDPVSGNLSVTSSMEDLLSTSAVRPIVLNVLAEEVTRSVAEKRALSASTQLVVMTEVDAQKAPRFGKAMYSSTLVENQSPGSMLIFSPPLKTTGQRGTFTLGIVGGLAERCFEVVPSVIKTDSEFDIRVKNSLPLDFETLPSRLIQFKVVAEQVDRSPGRPPLRSHANVTVTVLDQNDNTPVFDKDVYDVIVDEDVKRGTIILKVTATDNDGGSNGRVVYNELLGDNAADLSIDPNSGEISVKVSRHGFDFEQQQEYRLLVRATDSGVPERTGTASIRLQVQDVNDNGPQFNSRVYNGKLSADGSSLVQPVKVHAEDKDAGSNGRVSYRISGGGRYHTNFDVDRSTGIILVRKPVVMEDLVDYGSDSGPSKGRLSFERYGPEQDGVIQLRVMAVDGGNPQRSSEVPVYIYQKENVESYMTFVVGKDYNYIRANQGDVERELSVFTGGTAEITDIQPYTDNQLGGRNIDGEQRSIITALVRRRYDAMFDTTSLSGEFGGGGRVDRAAANEVWFWLLLVLFLLVIFVLCLLGCCFYSACCADNCPDFSCYRKRMVDVVDEEAVAYVSFDKDDTQRMSNNRNVTMLGRVREVVSGRSGRSRLAWSGGRRWGGHLAGGSRTSNSSRLRLVEPAAQRPDSLEDFTEGREHVVLVREQMDEQMARVQRRDGQIILVPGDIASLHRTNSRASRTGATTRLYQVRHGDSAPTRLHVLAAAAGDGTAAVGDHQQLYQLEDLDDSELERLELERRSLIVEGAVSNSRTQADPRRVSPSVEVLTLDDGINGSDSLYRRQGNVDVLHLASSTPRSTHPRHFYVDQNGESIERPPGRGRVSDDEQVRYGAVSPTGSRHPGRRTRSEILVLDGRDHPGGTRRPQEEELLVVEDDRDDDEEHRNGKAMIMRRFIDSQGRQRVEAAEAVVESVVPAEVVQAPMPVPVEPDPGKQTITRRTAHVIKTPIQEETQSVLAKEDVEHNACLSPQPFYSQTKASILRKRHCRTALCPHKHGRSHSADDNMAATDERSAYKMAASQRDSALRGRGAGRPGAVESRRRRDGDKTNAAGGVRHYGRQRSRSDEVASDGFRHRPVGSDGTRDDDGETRRSSLGSAGGARESGGRLRREGARHGVVLDSAGSLRRLDDESSRPGSQLSLLNYSSHMLNDQLQRSRTGSPINVIRQGSASSQRNVAQHTQNHPTVEGRDHKPRASRPVAPEDDRQSTNKISKISKVHGSSSETDLDKNRRSNPGKFASHFDRRSSDDSSRRPGKMPTKNPQKSNIPLTRSRRSSVTARFSADEEERAPGRKEGRYIYEPPKRPLQTKKTVHYAEAEEQGRRRSKSSQRDGGSKSDDERRRKKSRDRVGGGAKKLKSSHSFEELSRAEDLAERKARGRDAKDHTSRQFSRRVIGETDLALTNHQVHSGEVTSRPPRASDVSGDSGIGGDVARHVLTQTTASAIYPDSEMQLVPGMRRKRNQFLEKKSIFTIAYDDVHTDNLRSDSPQAADI